LGPVIDNNQGSLVTTIMKVGTDVFAAIVTRSGFWATNGQNGVTRVWHQDASCNDPAITPDSQSLLPTAGSEKRSTNQEFNTTTTLWIADSSQPVFTVGIYDACQTFVTFYERSFDNSCVQSQQFCAGFPVQPAKSIDVSGFTAPFHVNVP